MAVRVDQDHKVHYRPGGWSGVLCGKGRPRSVTHDRTLVTCKSCLVLIEKGAF